MTAADIQAVLDAFTEQLYAGQNPDPNEVILAHPDAAAELERELDAVIALYQESLRRLQVPGYRIGEVLGSGASADVYRATGPDGTAAAVKVLRPGAGTQAIDRFHREAAIQARLVHPNIVRLLDRGVTADARPFQVLQLCPDGSLDDRLKRGAGFGPWEAAALVAKVADALHFAHEKGIVHRDLKPANVLVGADGEPLLCDFDLGRDAAGEALTVAGAVLGTPAYMAPEQVRGQNHRVGPWTDVYGLGATFYHLLTGRVPFDGQSASLEAQIVSHTPTPPDQVNPAVPPELATVCLTCLAKHPADRYESAAELSADLGRVIAGGKPKRRRPWLGRRLVSWWRRLPMGGRVLSGAVAALVVLSAVLGFWVWSAVRQANLNRQAADLAERERDFAEEQKTTATQQRARVVVRNALDQGWQYLRAKQSPWRAKLLAYLGEVYRESRNLPDAEREAARLEARSLYAMSLAYLDFEPVPGGRLNLPASVWAAWPALPHPDGKWIAVATPQGPRRFAQGDSTEKPPGVAAPPLGQRMPRIAYSPDGAYLAFAPATGGLQLWDGAVKGPVVELEKAGPPVLAVGFGDGVIRACRADGRVLSWGLKDWTPGNSWEAGKITSARFSADATRLAVGDRNGHVRVLSRVRLLGASVPVSRDLNGRGVRTDVESLAWSPDGRTLAAGFREGVVVVWNPDGRDDYQVAPFANGVDDVSFSPDGIYLIATRRGESTHLWDAGTGELLCTTSGQIAFARDGHTAAAAGLASAELVGLVGPGAVRPLRGHQALVRHIAWAQDGRRLATLDARRAIRVWDAETGRRTDAFQAPIGDFYPDNASLAFDRDGRRLAYASGGRESAQLLVRDVESGSTVGVWLLPGGYEQLAAAQEGGFLLVREEFVPDAGTTRSMLWAIRPGDRPNRVRMLRESQPDDIRRYLAARLSPDGRYYVWSGPREPRDRWRVEVIEVATGRRVYLRPFPGREGSKEPGIGFHPGGRLVSIGSPDPVLIELPGPDGGTPAERPFERWAAAGEWHLGQGVLPGSLGETSFVSPGGTGRPLLALHSPSLGAWGPVGVISCSRDTRRVAWADSTGVVFLADLPALGRELAAHEAALR